MQSLLAIMSGPPWSMLGLVLSLVGVLLLFRFGIPYRLRPAEGDYIVTRSATKDPKDTVYSICRRKRLLGATIPWAFL